MGVQTDVVIAERADAGAIAESDTPTAKWRGFTFNGFDHVQVCTLLSIMRTGQPDTEFQRYLEVIEPVAVGGEEGPIVVGIQPEQVTELAVISGLEETKFEELTKAWAETEEFSGWSVTDVRDLLEQLADLADSASLEGKWLMLWQSL